MTPEERKDWEHDGDLALLRDENDKLRWDIARLQVLLADALSDLAAAASSPCEGVIIGREVIHGCMDVRLGGCLQGDAKGGAK